MNTQSVLHALQGEVDEFLTTQPGSEGEQRLLGDAVNLPHQHPNLNTFFADRRPGQIAGEAAKRSFGIFDAEDATRVAAVVAALVRVADESERASVQPYRDTLEVTNSNSQMLEGDLYDALFSTSIDGSQCLGSWA